MGDDETMLDLLKKEATAQHVLVTMLQDLPTENQVHVLDRIVEQLLGAKITFSRRLGPPDNPRAPRGFGIDETVALAIVLGRLRNGDVASFCAMTSKGADQRIQSAKDAGRIERVSQGVYEATEEEYVRIGLDPKKKGYPFAMKAHEIVVRMQKRLRDLKGDPSDESGDGDANVDSEKD